jgi:general secretion pathway protein D
MANISFLREHSRVLSGRKEYQRFRNIGMLLVLLLFAPVLAAESVTLNLKDADISALISTVSDVTGKNFIIDPRVKGKVTVVSNKPMDSKEVYQVFLSILKVHGFAAVPSGSVIKIVPDVNAKQDSISTATDSAPGRGDEMVTRVVQVDNVAAAQLVPILRPLVPQQGHLAAYPSTNVLILSDRASNVDRLVSIVRRIDKVSDSEIEVIPLQHASATEVVRVLTALNRAAPTAGKVAVPAAGGPTLIADERTNSVLMSGDRSQRLRTRAIISHLDTPLDTVGNTKVIYLKYAEATELVDVLTGVGQVKEEEAKGKKQAPQPTQFDIQADEATNAVVITAAPDVMRSIEGVIRQLDVRRAQVLVEAVIAEISADNQEQLGVQWIFDGSANGNGPVGIINFTNTGSPIADIGDSVLNDTVPAFTGGTTIGVGSFTGDFRFAAIIRALSNDAKTNILSTPTLVTMDNEEAEIIIGENVPFVTGSFSDAGGVGSVNPFQTIQREDVGLTLRITPQINEGDAVKMDIEQEVSNISDSTEGVDLITNKRSIKTSVIVGDNEVLVLGGLMEDRVLSNAQKVPLLGDIPLVGHLFRSDASRLEKTNLMVFIHPTILRDDLLASRYTNSKYNLLRTQQLMRDEEGIPLMPGASQPILKEWEEISELPPPYLEEPPGMKEVVEVESLPPSLPLDDEYEY